jgi:hypothetical protein
MAHYAFLDENNIVTDVIVGKDEGEDGINWEEHYGNFRGQVCKRTSYNTFAGIHSGGGTPFRKNFAGVGYTYDTELDAFIPPKPFNSWILNSNTALWEAPVAIPEDAGTGDPPKMYSWDEDSTSWQPSGNSD